MSHPFNPGSLVAAYVRDSGGEDQDLSTAQQENEIRGWCAVNGLGVWQVYCDAASPGSSTVGRAAFARMIHDFHQPCPAAGVVVWRSNRFGRNINDSQFFKADLRRLGFHVYSLTDQIPSGAMGQFIEFALDWKDQVFIEQLSEDVRRGLRSIVSQYGAVPGRPPVGFQRVPVTVGTRRDGRPHILNRWEPDPAQSEIIRQAFELRANGASYRVILQHMGGLIGSVGSLNTLFKNKLYKGELEFGDLLIADYCPPIVTPTLWAAVQSVNRTRGRVTAKGGDHPRRVNSRFLLSGLIYCQVCGSLMHGQAIGENDYYACSRRKRTHECPARHIPKEPIETAVIEHLLNDVLTLECLLNVQARFAEAYAKTSANVQAEYDQVNATLAELNRKITNITRAIGEAGHSPALLASLKQMESEQADLSGRLILLNQTLAPPQILTGVQLSEIASGIITRLQTDADAKRESIRLMVNRLLVRRDDDKIYALLEVHPPITSARPAPDHPGGQELGQRLMSPWGHYAIDLIIPVRPHKAPRP